MGLFEYWCAHCEKPYKMWKHIEPVPVPTCPTCGSKGEKQLGVVVRFEGNQEHWQTPRATPTATPEELVDD